MTDEKNWSGNDNLAFLDEVMAHTKAAAGLSADWGWSSSPLSAEEDLEDAPRPPRLRDGMTTAELLPYGEPVRLPDGRELVLERITCAPIQTPTHGIEVCDPVSLEWQGAPIAVDLRGSAQPVEVAAVRHATPRGDLIEAAVAVVGSFSRATTWIEFPVPGTRLSIDTGCGAFIARNHVGTVADTVDEDVLRTLSDVGLLPVEHEGDVVGALFDGRAGGYEVMLGRGHGRPTALLVDLGVLPR